MQHYRCAECTLVFAAPAPDSATLVAYNRAYFDNAHGGAPADRLSLAYHRAMSQLRAMHVLRHVADAGGTLHDVLEVGPGSGFFLDQVRERHPSVQLSGLESDDTSRRLLGARGIRAYGNADELDANIRFDLIVLSHVLEHVAQPRSFLGGLVSRLRPGGWLFVEVPCLDYQYKELDEPHLLCFDKPSLDVLLAQMPLVDVRTSYHGEVIERLRAASGWRALRDRIRSRLILLGFARLLAGREAALDGIADPVGRAIIRPFQAHCEQPVPARWLRAVARRSA
jgi:SAM-dependent methyltransferase